MGSIPTNDPSTSTSDCNIKQKGYFSAFFEDLTAFQKIITVVASIFGLLGFGVGSVWVFTKVTHHFVQLNREQINEEQRTVHSLAVDILTPKQETETQELLVVATTSTTQEPVTVASPTVKTTTEQQEDIPKNDVVIVEVSSVQGPQEDISKNDIVKVDPVEGPEDEDVDVTPSSQRSMCKTACKVAVVVGGALLLGAGAGLRNAFDTTASGLHHARYEYSAIGTALQETAKNIEQLSNPVFQESMTFSKMLNLEDEDFLEKTKNLKEKVPSFFAFDPFTSTTPTVIANLTSAVKAQAPLDGLQSLFLQPIEYEGDSAEEVLSYYEQAIAVLGKTPEQQQEALEIAEKIKEMHELEKNHSFSEQQTLAEAYKTYTKNMQQARECEEEERQLLQDQAQETVQKAWSQLIFEKQKIIENLFKEENSKGWIFSYGESGLVEVIPEDTGYTVSLYDSACKGEKERSQCFFTWENVDSQILKSPEFAQFLLNKKYAQEFSHLQHFPDLSVTAFSHLLTQKREKKEIFKKEISACLPKGKPKTTLAETMIQMVEDKLGSDCAVDLYFGTLQKFAQQEDLITNRALIKGINQAKNRLSTFLEKRIDDQLLVDQGQQELEAVLKNIEKRLLSARFDAAVCKSGLTDVVAESEWGQRGRAQSKAIGDFTDLEEDLFQPSIAEQKTSLVLLPKTELLIETIHCGWDQVIAQAPSEKELYIGKLQGCNLDGITEDQAKELVEAVAKKSEELFSDKSVLASQALIEGLRFVEKIYQKHDLLSGEYGQFSDWKMPVDSLQTWITQASDSRTLKFADNTLFRERIKEEKLYYYHSREQIIKPLSYYLSEKKTITQSFGDPNYNNVKNIAYFATAQVAERAVKEMENFSLTIEQQALISPDQVVQSVKNFCKESFPSLTDTSVFEALSEEQVEKALTTLGTLGHSFLQSLLLSKQVLTTPETMICFMELLAMADKLMAYSTIHNLLFFSMPLEDFMPLYDGESLFFRVFDPDMEQRVQNIRNWMAKRRKVYDVNVWNSKRGKELFVDFNGYFSQDSTVVQEKYFPEKSYQTFFADLEEIYALTKEGHSHRISDWNYDIPRESFPKRYIEAYFTKSDFVPDYFYQLRSLAHAAQHAAKSIFSVPKQFVPKKGDLQPQMMGKIWETTGKIGAQLTGIDQSFLSNYKDLPTGKDVGHQFQYTERPLKGNIPAVQDVRNAFLQPASEYRPGLDKQRRTYFDPNRILARGVPSTLDHPLDYIQQVSLRAEPATQLFHTLSLFQEHPDWLQDLDQRIEFMNLLFDPTLLLRELAKPVAGPEFENRLAEYIVKQFKLNQGSLDLQFYFVELAVRLQVYSEFARKHNPEIYHEKILPSSLLSLSALPKEIVQSTSSSEQRGSYSGLVAMQYLHKEEISDQELIEALRAAIQFNSLPSLDLINPWMIKEEVSRLLYKLSPRIEKMMQDKVQLSNLLQQILKEKDSKKIESIQIEFPVVSHPDFYVDFLEGVVRYVGQEGGFLPSDAMQSSGYQMVFGSEAYRGKTEGLNSFSFSDSSGIRYRIKKQGGVWCLYRQKDLQWQRLITPALKEGIFPSKSLHTNYLHWKQGDLLLLEEKGGKQQIQARIVQQKAVAIRQQFEGKELVLADLYQRPSDQWIEGFEKRDWCHLWVKEGLLTSVGEKLEFPRMGQSFFWDQEVWKSNEYPGFFIAPYQEHPLFSGQKGFLLLESEKGDKRLLIPSFPYQVQDRFLRENISYQSDQNQKEVALFQYDQDPKTGAFFGTTRRANYHLASLCLAQGDYLQAASLLQKITVYKNPLTDQERAIIRQIHSGDGLPFDDSIEAQAIRLQAFLILSEKEDQPSFPMSENLLQTYLQIMQRAPALRLPFDQESTFLSSVLIQYPEIDQGLALLKKQSPESFKLAVKDTLERIVKRENVELKTEFLDGVELPFLAPFCEEIRENPFSLALFTEIFSVENTASSSLPEQISAVYQEIEEMDEPEKTVFQESHQAAVAYFSAQDSANYAVKDFAKLSQRIDTMQKGVDELEEQMTKHEWNAVVLANTFVSDPKKKSLRQQQLFRGGQTLVLLSDLLQLYQEKDLSAYQRRFLGMEQELAEKIHCSLQQMVHLQPELSYQRLLLDQMRQIQQDPKNQEKMAALARSVRNGKERFIEKSGMMEVLEYQTRSYYREGQIKSLYDLGVGSPNSLQNATLVRSQTGSGKTSRLAPTKVVDILRQGLRAAVVIPQEQVAATGQELQKILDDVWGIQTFVVNFSRQDLNKEKIKEKIRIWKGERAKESVVITTPKSLRVLYNLFRSSFMQYLEKRIDGKSCEEEKETFIALQELLKVIREETKFVVDETQKAFDSQIETNFPEGDQVSTPAEYAQLSLQMYKILAENPKIATLMHFDFLGGRKVAGSHPFTPKEFHEKVVPIVIDQLLTVVKEDTEMFPEFSQYVKGCTVDKEEKLKTFFTGKGDLDSVTGSLQELFWLIRGQLNIYMPLSLQRKYGRHYGFADKKDLHPCPFSAAQRPNQNSQYSSPYLRHDTTIQAVYHEGVSSSVIEGVIRQLQNARIQELLKIEEEVLDYSTRKTAADQTFQKIFSQSDLGLETKGVVDILLKRLQKNEKVIYSMLEDVILPQITFHEKNLKATSQNIGGLMGDWVGFSATTDEYPAYPGEVQPIEDLASKSAIMVHLLENPSSVEEVEAQTPMQLLQGWQDVDAIIDAGSIFANQDPLEVAKQWSQDGQSVVYIDKEQGALVVSDQSFPVQLDRSGVSIEKRKTFYDQPNTVGTDIAHKKDAVAVVTYTASMTFDDLEQGAGRMRGIGQGQTVRIATTKDTAFLIREELEIAENVPLLPKDIVRYAKKRSAQKRKEKVETAVGQKISAVAENAIVNEMIDLDLENIDDEGWYRLTDQLFRKSVPYDPSQVMNDSQGRKDTEAVLEEKKAVLMDQLKRFIIPVWKESSTDFLVAIEKKMSALIKSNQAFLGKTLPVIGAVGANEQEQEILQEQNQETETEQQVLVEQEQRKIDDIHQKSADCHLAWPDLDTETIASWHWWFSSEGPKIVPVPDHDMLYISKNIFSSKELLPGKAKPTLFTIVVMQKGDQVQGILVEPYEAARLQETYYRRKGIALPILPVETGMDPAGSKENKETIDSQVYPEKGWQVRGGQTDKGDALFWMGDLSGAMMVGDAEVAKTKQFSGVIKKAKNLVNTLYYQGG